MYKHKNNKRFIKKILFLTAFLLLLTLIWFSGCISFCSLSTNPDKECISYSEALNKCKEISEPINEYPICSDFSKITSLEKLNTDNCEKEYNAIANIPKYNNLSTNVEQYANYFRDSIINAWKTSDKLAYSFLQVNNSCDSFLNNDFVKYETQLKTVAKDFDYYNNNIIFYFIGTINATKKELEDMNVELMQNTLVYQDYLELINILNEFQKAMGKDLKIKDTLAKDTIYFYAKYYANDNSRTLLADAIANMNTNFISSDIIGTYTTILTLSSGPIGIINSSMPELLSALSKYTNYSEKISDILDNAAQKTDLSEWNKLDIIKEMLSDFYFAHAKNSLSDKYLFEILNKIDKDIEETEKEYNSRFNALYKKVDKLYLELDSKIQETSKYNSLYDKYSVIDSPYNLLSKISNIKTELNQLLNLKLGNKYNKLIALEYNFSELEKETKNYLTSDLSSILSLCLSDIIIAKSKIELMPESDNKILLLNYCNSFLDTKDESKKLIYCSKFSALYSQDTNSTCISSINNLFNNTNLTLKNTSNITELLEGDCEQIIYSKISDLKNTAEYKSLEILYAELYNLNNTLDKLKNNSKCLSNKDYSFILDSKDKYVFFSKYSKDSLVNAFLISDVKTTKNNLSNFLTEYNKIINKSIVCNLENDYELDLENKKLIINSYFGEQNNFYELSIPNYGIENIIKGKCLKDYEITKTEIKLNLSCLKSVLKYDVIVNKTEPKTEIISFTSNANYGTLNIKKCLPTILSLEQYFDYPINKEHILNVNVYVDNSLIISNYDESKLKVIFTNLSYKEQCANIIYYLRFPLNEDLNLISVVDNANYTSYFYSLSLKNNLLMYADKLKYFLSFENYNSKIYFDNKDISSNMEDGYKYLILNDLLPFENRKLLLELRLDDSNVYFVYQISSITDSINSLKKYSIVNENLITKFVTELNKATNLTNKTDKVKALNALEKEVNKELSNVIENNTLISRYNYLLLSSKNILNEYVVAKQKLQKDYNILISDLDQDYVHLQITDAEELYSENKVKEAVEILKNIKPNVKIIEKSILNIFENSLTKTKDLEKQYKKLNLSTNDFLTLNALSDNLTQYLDQGKYFEALGIIDQYNSKQKELINNLNSNIKLYSKEFSDIILKYNLTKLKLDSLWQKYSLFEADFLSDKYDLVKKFGITFSFDKSSVNQIKTKLSNTTKEIINLDKLVIDLNKNNVDLLISFDKSKFQSFFDTVNNLNDSIDGYQKELRSKANNELVLSANVLGNNANQEFYKAKNAYDENNFVNSIYFSKVSLLGLSDTSNNDFTLYVGIGIIIFIAIIIVLFGRKINFSFIKGKGNTEKVEKQSYYTIDREE